MIRHFFLDPQFEKTARNTERLRNVPLPPFVALTHIDQYGVRLRQHPARLVDIDLLDGRTRLIKDILRSLHFFTDYLVYASRRLVCSARLRLTAAPPAPRKGC